MQLVVEDFEAYAPVILQSSPMSDAEFVKFCERYPDCRIECTADGEIIIMPPNFTKGSYRNSLITTQLCNWTEADGRGWAFDSSGGFVLPNGARRSPDSSWVSKARVARLPEEHLEGFFRLCPEFVVELRSATDRLDKLQAKMTEWIDNGAELGWLIDPRSRSVWIYRRGRTAERLEGPERLRGEGPVEGFELDLRRVWEGIQ